MGKELEYFKLLGSEDELDASKEYKWAFKSATEAIETNWLLEHLKMTNKMDKDILQVCMAARISRGKINELSRRKGIRRKLSESSMRKHIEAYEEIAKVKEIIKAQYTSEEGVTRAEAINYAADDFVRRVEQSRGGPFITDYPFNKISKEWANEWSVKIYSPKEDLFLGSV